MAMAMCELYVVCDAPRMPRDVRSDSTGYTAVSAWGEASDANHMSVVAAV